MPRNNVFEKGISLIQQGRVQDALKVLEEAVEPEARLKRQKTVIQSKSLDQLVGSLRNFGSLTNQAPSSSQGRRRSERLSSHYARCHAAFKILELSLWWARTSGIQKTAQLEALHDEILVAMKPPRITFQGLPVELQIEIFFFAISSRRSAILSLALVCRAWKELVYETPSLWRRLVFDFSSRTTQIEADTWLKRANGVVRNLRVDRLPAQPDLDILRNAAEDFWSKLEELELLGDNIPKLLTEEIIRQLRLRSIYINYPGIISVRSWKIMRMLDESFTRTLRIKIGYGRIELEGMVFSKLTTLELTGYCHSAPFFDLLRRNPALETLILTHTQFCQTDGFLGVNDPVHLPRLWRIELAGNGPFDTILRSVNAPNIAVVRLQSMCYHDIATLCIEEVLSRNITGIHQLYLDNCKISTQPLLSLLRSSLSLTTLMLSRNTVDINQVINALCRPVSVPGLDAPHSLPCPKLQFLDVSWSSDLGTRATKRLVRSRLENPENGLTTTQTHSGNHPLPILHLNTTGCHHIQRRALTWLRSVVPCVIHNK